MSHIPKNGLPETAPQLRMTGVVVGVAGIGWFQKPPNGMPEGSPFGNAPIIHGTFCAACSGMRAGAALPKKLPLPWPLVWLKNETEAAVGVVGLVVVASHADTAEKKDVDGRGCSACGGIGCAGRGPGHGANEHDGATRPTYEPSGHSIASIVHMTSPGFWPTLSWEKNEGRAFCANPFSTAAGADCGAYVPKNDADACDGKAIAAIAMRSALTVALAFIRFDYLK